MLITAQKYLIFMGNIRSRGVECFDSIYLKELELLSVLTANKYLLFIQALLPYFIAYSITSQLKCLKANS